MRTGLARRPAAAVRALEQLQRDERATAGDPLPQSDHEAILIQAIRRLTPSEARSWAGPGGDAAYQAYLDSIRDRLASDPDPETEQQITQDSHAFHLNDAGQWSAYEPLVMRWRLADACSRIESAIGRYAERRWQDFRANVIAGEDTSWTLPALPAVGTLNTGQVVATTQPAETGEVLVLVENGLFDFARMLAQLGVMVIHETADGGQLSPATLMLVCDIAAAQTVIGTCAGSHQRATPPAYRMHVKAAQDAIVTFVLSHEYGHLLNGDMTAHPLGGEEDTGTGLAARELAADVKGLRISLSAGVTTPLEGAAAWGPVLYLAGLDLLDRARAAYEHRPYQPTGTGYPTPFERMASLLGMIEKSALAEVFGTAVQTAAEAYQQILFAWDVIQPAMWDASQQLSQYEAVNLSDPREVEWYRLNAQLLLWSRVTGQPWLGDGAAPPEP